MGGFNDGRGRGGLKFGVFLGNYGYVVNLSILKWFSIDLDCDLLWI